MRWAYQRWLLVLGFLLSPLFAAAAPVINSLTPNTGAVGSAVVIAGSGFGNSQSKVTVKFNGTTATITSFSSTSITATVPTGATTGNVVVTVSGVASNGVTFTVTPAPSITSLTPNTGAVGSSIVIGGSNFGPSQGNGNVKLNGTSATITNWTATSITATVPTGATTGSVVVTAAGGVASNGVTFTVTPAPNISSLTPSSGAVGSSIVIGGSNFGPSQGNGSVKFNGTAATVTAWSATQVTATVPTGATTGNVVVTAAGGVASNGVSFTVTPAPSITSLTPNSGAVGSSIVIAGSNFGSPQGTGTVTFNGTAAAVSTWSSGSITVTVPAGATTGNVVVTAPGGVASNGVSFTVTSAPSITSLTPNNGAVGSSIVIAGSNFGPSQGNGNVKFNGTSATITNWSASSVTATVPTGAATGNVVVTAAGGVASNGVNFTVTPAPNISSLTPSSGAVASSVTITGTNFGATQGNGNVTFNGTTATISNWGSGSITATVPANATTGNVVVTAAGGVQSNGISFTVTPAITSLTPISGAVGATVTIAGTTFGSTAGTVTFNGTSASATWGNSSITATVPSGATTGPVVITTSGGLASNGVTFTVTPNITSLSVTSGPVGTQVTITGTTFGSTAGTVTFNGAAASTTWGNSSIDATVPAAATTGPVVVTTSAGVASNGVNFTVLPNITSLSLTSGAVGTQLIITGTTFGSLQGNSTVTFNGTLATAISSWNSTSIGVPVPNGATTGSVVVTVAGNASNGVLFTVVGAPNISGLTPSSGIVGTSVAIAGTNFGSSQGNGTVTFNGLTASSIGPWSNTGITATVPSGATTGNVVVTAAGGVQSNGVIFTVLPNITSLNPSSGSSGTSVTIFGSNFGASTGTVAFNGLSAAISSWSAGNIVAIAPNGLSSGNVVVTTAGGTASNGVFFALAGQVFTGPVTYSYDELGRLVGAVAASGDAVQYSYDAVGNITAITRFTSGQEALFSFTPRSGPVGTQVTITGANFSATAAQDTVSFNGTAATISSASPNSLVVSVPTGATTGPITVASPNGSVTSAESFTVTTSSSAPTISSFTPAIVSPGTAVTISGTNFDPTPANDRLLVNITNAAGTTPTNSTTLTMTTPSKSGSGHIYLSTSGGSTVSAGDLFIPPPAYTVSQVAVTGRASFGNSTTASIPANDIVMFLVDGISGHGVSVSVTSSNISDCRLRLYAPDNSAVGTTYSVCSNGFIQPQTLPMTGTYAIVIFAANGSSGSITFTPNDIPADVSGTTALDGSALIVATSIPGQKARYTFNGTANELITAVEDNTTYTNYFNVQGVFQIIAPDGTVVRSFNAPLSGDSWLEDVNYCLHGSTSYPCAGNVYTAPLPATGTYTLYLNPAGWSTGQLRVRLFGFGSDVSTATTAGTATSPSIPVSMTTAGQNAKITFPVDITQQQRVSFAFNNLSMSSVTGDFTPNLNFMVLDNTGNPIGGFAGQGQVFSYSAGTTSAYAEFPNNLLFQSSGTYAIWIDPTTDATASLNLNVYDATDKSVAVAADGSSNSLTTAAPGQNFSFNISGTQGQRVSAVVSNLSGLTSPGLTVKLLEQWNAKGTAIQDGSNYFLDTITLGATDTFNLYVDPAGTDVGSAMATIYTVPADFSSTIDTVGDPVVVTTTTPGQNAQLTFTVVNSFPPLTVQITNGSYPAGKCTATISLSGGGSFNAGDCSGSTQTWHFSNLGPAGTYTINIDPVGSATGSATFSVTLH
jgi:YD repeat-containing protein